MHIFLHQYGFSVLICIFTLLLASCTSNNSDSNNKPIATQPHNISAPTSLQGSALAFEITKTEMIHGTDPRIATDGNFKNYFTADRVFNDGREYGGFSWGAEYEYSVVNKKGEIIQQLKLQENGANIELNMKMQLTYVTPTSGNFALEVKHIHSLDGLIHLTHTGKFQLIENKLDMMEKGLPYSNMHFTFQTIGANQDNIEIKAGSKIKMVFNNPQSAKFTLNNKDYETKDYQLIAVDTFNKRIKGTFNGDTPFEIKLHFDRFDAGQFEASIGNDAFKASGVFMSERWVPVTNYNIQGKFTDGFKFTSKHTNIEYPYSVYLPPNYATSNKKYPVLYLTDGQWVKEFYKIVEAHDKDFIVIAIEEGPADRRWEDYKLPGAAHYIRFLKEELIPQIETQYRTNSNRLFWGASLGVALGEILLSQETDIKPYFNTYTFSDGFFWANPPEIREKLKTTLAQPKSETLSIFTSSTRQGLYVANSIFMHELQSFNNPSLVLKDIEFKETHTELPTLTFEAFIDAMN